MKKYHKQLWVSIFLLGMAFLIYTPIYAVPSSRPAMPRQVSQCQMSLKEASSHLESNVPDHPYYDSLYQQTQVLLKNLVTLPPTTALLGQCQNFLKVIQDVVGNHVDIGSPVDLGSLSSEALVPTGQLSTPALETAPRRRFGKTKAVRYIVREESERKLKDSDFGEKEPHRDKELQLVSIHSIADKLKDRE